VPWYPIITNVTHSDYEHIQMPSSVWTASLRQGFIGCLKNIRINGLNAQIVNIFESQNENSNFYTKGILIINIKNLFLCPSVQRLHSLVVEYRTQQSRDPGSIPGGVTFLYLGVAL
jgi:hypothetical protein